MPEDGALEVEEQSGELSVSERVQKVDLRKISILELAEQYLAFVRDQKGREFFARGQSVDVTQKRVTEWGASLSDLLKAYARVKTKEDFQPLHLNKRDKVMTLEEALEGMRSMIGASLDWSTLSSFLPEGWQVDPKRRRSAIASSFLASLELAKRGEIELKQEGAFKPVLIRKKSVAHV